MWRDFKKISSNNFNRDTYLHICYSSCSKASGSFALGCHSSQCFARMLKFQQRDCEKPLARLHWRAQRVEMQQGSDGGAEQQEHHQLLLCHGCDSGRRGEKEQQELQRF